MAVNKESASGEASSSNVKTGQLAMMITEIGPNISEIARQLGQFKESVRYRYKEKLLSKGFAVQVAVDHEKLGLRRLVMLVDFEENYKPVAKKMLNLLSDEGFLVGYEQILPDGRYIIHCSVPEECIEDYRSFITALQKQGIFKSMRLQTFQWFRNPPMKTNMYDFDEGVWDFDWSADARPNKSDAAYQPSSKEKFDAIDLMILRQLQKDANTSLADMAESLKVNYKTLTWHFRKHIEERRLIKGYIIRWMGSKYDYKADRAANKKHTYIYVAVMFAELDQAKRLEVIARLNALPFIWSEAVGDTYEAELVFPIESLTEGLQYIAKVIADTKVSAEYFIIDQANAFAFTIMPELYDESRQRWKFNQEHLLMECERLLIEIREGTTRAVPSDLS
jgi:DNA-binding Lrp family transcriptional regulator